MDNEEEKFYRGRAWDLLISDIKEIKNGQDSLVKDVNSIKDKMAWIFGMVAGITFVFNMGWQYVVNRFFKK